MNNKKIVYDFNFILSNIEEVVEQATFSHLIEAKSWYPKARQECLMYSAQHNVDFEVVAGICSCLSVMKSWHSNLVLTQDFLKGNRWGHFSGQINKATKILGLDGVKSVETQKETIRFILNGPKTRNFYGHISNPLDNTQLVIDTHMLNVCYGGLVKSLTNKQYEFLKNLLIKQAKRHNLASSEYQSLLWLMMKYVKKKV